MNTPFRFRPLPVLLAAALPLALAACASAPDRYAPLASLQQEFQQARTDQVPALAPVAFREAERALETAERALGDAGEERMRHLTYLADAQLGIAQAEADRARAEQERRTLADRREQILLQARDRQIGQARTDVERARQDAMASAVAAEEERMRAQELESRLAEFQARRTAQGTVLTLSNLLFEVDSAALHPGDRRRLQPLADYLKENTDRSILIEGHTDASGSDQYNLSLSQNRANAVRDFLVAEGVDPARVRTRGVGEDYPVATNETSNGRQQNRRIEVTLGNPQGRG